MPAGTIHGQDFVTVTAIEDTETFEDHLITVSGTSPESDTVADPEDVTLTILDSANDVPLLVNRWGYAETQEGDEGTVGLDFLLVLSRVPFERVSVRYTTVDDTAAAGEDYEAASDLATFEAGDTTASFSVMVIGDETVEPDERFGVRLSEPTGGAVLGTERTYGIIANDDDGSTSRHLCSFGSGTSERTVGIADATAREGKSARFRITMDRRRSCQDTSVWVTTFPRTASENTDYTGLRDHLVHLEAGATEAVLEIPTVTDQVREDRETFWVRIRAAGSLARITTVARDTAVGRILDLDEPLLRIPMFPAANGKEREGFVRIVNPGEHSQQVEVKAFDELGQGYESARVDIRPVRRFISTRVIWRTGMSQRASSEAPAPGYGDWRLDLHAPGGGLLACAFLRTSDGFLTSLHDSVQEAGPTPGDALPQEAVYPVPLFNGGANFDQVSLLRIVNFGEESAVASILGTDDAGATAGPVRLTLQGGETRTVTTTELEAGTGLDGRLGKGEGKWRLTVTSARPLRVLSLMESPTGHLSNLSTVPYNEEPSTVEGAEQSDADLLHRVLLFPVANNVDGHQGVVRVVNRGDAAGTVTIKARDDSEWNYEPVEMRISGREAVNFSSDDLELGNDAKSLSSGVGAGVGIWRLELTSQLDIDVLSYIETKDGFLTAMHDVVPASLNAKSFRSSIRATTPTRKARCIW